jgi:two-component system, OmpR family, response regulator MprA
MQLGRRLGRLLRRASAAGDVLHFADLQLCRRTRTVMRASRPIELTRTEFDLLEFFLSHPGRVLPRAEIAEHVWGFDFGAASNSMNVYVGYLRRKTESGGEPRLIHTVRGVGYILRES